MPESAISDKDWDFCHSCTMYKNCGIAQGVYKRSLQGNASSHVAGTYKEIAKSAANLAVSMLNGKYPYRLKPVKHSMLTYSDRFDFLQAE